MKIIKTKINDLVILKSKIFKDRRGFFKEVEKNHILKQKFIFDCFSYSKKNTLRGLHLQTNKSQAKIITVVQGKILDVVVDLRKKSKTYGKHFKIEISQNSNFSLFIPKGFAHGFIVLSELAIVSYKVDNYYDPNYESGVIWNDKDLNIDWKINANEVILSEKDKNLSPLAKIINPF